MHMAAVLAVANGNAGDTGSGNYRQRQEEKTRETCSEQWEKFARAMSKVSMTEGQATTGNMALDSNGVALVHIPSRTRTN